MILTQRHTLLSDEGTHGLIGLFYKDILGDAKNFRSFEDIKGFLYNYLVQYPKLSPYYPPLYHLLEAVFFSISRTIIAVKILNILITISAAFVIYKIGLKLGLKETSALIGLLFFLSFSKVFYFADKIVIDMLQILTFSVVIFYYLNIRNKKNLQFKEIIVFGALLSLAFITKFYSIFLPIIILTDSISKNRRLIKYLLISMVLSFLIISPYLYFYVKYNFYKLTFYLSRAYEAKILPTNWVYFDIFSNFGIFIGLYVSIALIFFIRKNLRNILILSWIFIPLLTLLILENKDFRFAFILLPIYAVACGYLFENLVKHWKKLTIVIIVLILSLQTVYNIYSSQSTVYPIEKIIKSIEKDGGNVLITSESPVHSADYMLYGDLNRIKGNMFRPCILEKGNLTKDLLKEWGIEYIIDQNNTIDENTKNILDIRLIKEERIVNSYIRLFKTSETYDRVDCNFVCLLNGTICKGQDFSNVLSLLNNRIASIVV